MERVLHIELDRPIKSVGPKAGTALADLDELIKQGLRAQLVSESMVTGQQSVNFSFFNPNKNPINLKGLIPGIREIPTVASSFDRLKASLNSLLVNLNKLPIEEIGNKVDDTLTTLNQTLIDADVLVKHVDKAIQPTLDDVQQAVAGAKDVLKNADGLVTELRERLGDVPYNVIFHSAPYRSRTEFHWHVHLLPKLTTRAGFEMGTGVLINVVGPEEGQPRPRERRHRPLQRDRRRGYRRACPRGLPPAERVA